VSGGRRGERLRDLVLGAASATVTGLAWRRLRQPGLPGAGPWQRTNHAGREVTLLEGVALVGGVATSSAAAAALGGARLRGHRRGLLATSLVSLAAGSVGALDDLRQDADRKGLKGHLGALARGQVTTGALKILVLAGSGTLAAAVTKSPSPVGATDDGVRHRGPARGLLDTLLGGAVVAGSANLANLLDLRPGRALKAGTLAAAPLLLTSAGSPPAAVATGAGAALLPDDLRGTAMLGDTGANPWGAVLGLALVERTGTRGRAVALAVLTGLTLASEKVSFTRVIESTPGLRELDAFGRRPVIPDDRAPDHGEGTG